MAAMPTPDLAVPYDAPRPVGRVQRECIGRREVSKARSRRAWARAEEGVERGRGERVEEGRERGGRGRVRAGSAKVSRGYREQGVRTGEDDGGRAAPVSEHHQEASQSPAFAPHEAAEG